MYFDEPSTMLSVPIIEVEAARLARKSSRLPQYRVALPF